MIDTHKWVVGDVIVVMASSINHEDKREITLEYLGDGILEDTSNGNRVWFNSTLFPTVFKGMCLSLGLTLNRAVCESYEVLRVL